MTLKWMTGSLGIAANAWRRSVSPVRRCAPQCPQNSPAGTLLSQCGHITSGGPPGVAAAVAGSTGGLLGARRRLSGGFSLIRRRS